MTKRVFYPGDVCRIREWDDMAEEFGEDEELNEILCEFTFTDAMRYLCGKTFTVKRVSGGQYFSEEHIETGYLRTYSISADMLELVGDAAIGEKDEFDACGPVWDLAAFLNM